MSDRALSEFERLLGDETSPWFEYNLKMASESLNQFTCEDWLDLQSKVLSFSACVQKRCAEAVGDFAGNDGVAVLTTLLASSPYLDVAAIAASQLDDMEITAAFHADKAAAIAGSSDRARQYSGRRCAAVNLDLKVTVLLASRSTPMLNKYDAMLSGVRECDDYWYDVAMSDAIDFLQHFSEEDWAGLEELVNERPALWQVSCAETLSESTDKERSFDLLTTLMVAGCDDVMVSALDSINALASYGLDIAGKAAQLQSAIAQAKGNSGAAASRMLAALEEKLPSA